MHTVLLHPVDHLSERVHGQAPVDLSVFANLRFIELAKLDILPLDDQARIIQDEVAPYFHLSLSRIGIQLNSNKKYFSFCNLRVEEWL